MLQGLDQGVRCCPVSTIDLVSLHVRPPVDALEKSSSLSSSDVVVDSAQNSHTVRQQRGKLSSLGKLFKPWKWRKKKTSDKFQDLSKGRTRSDEAA